MANVYGDNGDNWIDAWDGVTNSSDTVYGYDGEDTIFGLGGDDLLKGGAGDDTLHGGSDNDTLKGGAGADTLNGGSGFDTASYADSDAGVFVSLINDIASGGYAEGDDLNSIENLTGSSYDDDLWGNNSANVINGGAGEDTLKGYGGADTLNGGDHDDVLYGMDGTDTLNGGSGNDHLIGGANSDVLDGGVGNDTMEGGTGDDTYYVNSAGDVVTEAGGEGNDIVYSSAVSTTLANNVEILSLDTATDTGVNATGNAQANTIFGNVNDNVLDGGDGADTLSGLGGNDTFVFKASEANGDVVYEFNGNGGAAGDVLRFEGYGTLAEGATFHQLTATEWQITSADGTISEVITLAAGAVIDTTTDIMFV
jgi:Ca2+-binding RTX toxin-like protein